MDKFKFSSILQFLLFLIPIDIYVIGEWVGSGIQWGLFRYIIVDNHLSFIPLQGEILLVLNRTIYLPRTVLSIILWAIGACLLILAFCIIAFSYLKRDNDLLKKGSFLDAGAGLSF